jgi:hypothetical protein
MKIGITLNLVGVSFFSNGVNQNGIYLANLLSNIGYDVDILAGVDDPSKLKQSKEIVGKGIRCIEFSKSKKIRYDIIISVGLAFSKKDLEDWKNNNPNLKTVYYKCGNEFFFDLESTVYSIDKDRYGVDYIPVPDQIWSIPQMENTNLDYYSFVNSQQNATVVPFIWSPRAIDWHASKNSIGVYESRKITRFGIMEPNSSFMKNYLIPSMIVESTYRENKDIDILRIFSGSKLKDNSRVEEIFKLYKLHKDTKISLEKRYPTLDMLDKHIDCVVSWQIENNLNYLYLDVAWYGYPVLHNANLCPDVGYYYTANKIFEGSKKLQEIIDTHNSDTEYLERNRSIISRYLPENKEIQKNYQDLITDLVNGDFNKKSYDWKTNTIS